MEDKYFGIKMSLVCVYDALNNKREIFSNTAKSYIEDVADHINNYNKFFNFLKGEGDIGSFDVPNLRYIVSLVNKDASQCFRKENIDSVQNKFVAFSDQIRKLKSSPLEVYASENYEELKNFINGVGNGFEAHYDRELDFDD